MAQNIFILDVAPYGPHCPKVERQKCISKEKKDRVVAPSVSLLLEEFTYNKVSRTAKLLIEARVNMLMIGKRSICKDFSDCC